jgi:hypothetical protein
MSTSNLPGGKGQPARKADNLTAICESIVLENVGASTSHNPMGPHGCYRDSFTFCFYAKLDKNVYSNNKTALETKAKVQKIRVK